MQGLKGIRLAALAAICATIASAACAAPQALSPWDVQRYAAAFDAVDQGDFIDAEMQITEIKDRSLAGHLALRQLMHPTAHKASFEELARWLEQYNDLPGAERVYALAEQRRPAKAKPAKSPVLAGLGWSRIEQTAQGIAGKIVPDKARQAREAFYSGDLQRAMKLAPAAGERWIAGLAAYRLKNYAVAETYLSQVSRDETEDPWLRAGGAYWASRAMEEAGDSARAKDFLQAAAQYPTTFYGMIAERRMGMAAGDRPHETASVGQFLPASSGGPNLDLVRFIKSDDRAHRATGLAQIGRPVEAGLELRAGLSLAKSEEERGLWTSLIMALNAPLTSLADIGARSRRFAEPEYPTPLLEPKSGFTIDKALVYAIVRQESRFNPEVVSPSGAVGLMQLMPEAAARAAGDDKLKADMSPLFDPAFNLRVGQDYVTWLMERGVGHDILRTVAAYNGGPGTLLKTAEMVGDDADSLLLIECLPSQETRNYVEKVMAGYWTYRRKFGQESKTLDAVAMGARFVDARLDKEPS